MKVSQTIKKYLGAALHLNITWEQIISMSTVEYTWKDLFLSWPTTGIVQQVFFTIIRHVKTCKSASNAINIYFTYQYYHSDLFII